MGRVFPAMLAVDATDVVHVRRLKMEIKCWMAIKFLDMEDWDSPPRKVCPAQLDTVISLKTTNIDILQASTVETSIDGLIDLGESAAPKVR
jgi:hypothetical protein